MIDTMALLLLLLGLELVLGIDNVLVIAIFVEKLPKSRRSRARIMGLLLAMAGRIAMLWVILSLANLKQAIIFNLSIRDIILLAGGLFLLWKAVREIHNTVELKDQSVEKTRCREGGFTSIIVQIMLLDIVFSIDSVITAIGLTDKVWVIILAVILSFTVIMIYSKPVSEFIFKHPTIKILALSFLITIGITIFMEGLHKEVPKAYIYIPMGFALMVDMLQLRYEHNRKKKREKCK